MCKSNSPVSAAGEPEKVDVTADTRLDDATQTRVIHLLGSSASQYYFNLSLMYARLCAEEPELNREKYCFLFAVVFPNDTWKFPQSLSDEDLEAAPSMARAAGVAHLAQMEIDAAVPHMFCNEGMTTFRSLFDVLNIPHVGCPADCMALATDKAQTKGVLSAAGVQVPQGQLISEGQAITVKCPLVVKPAREDNSLGITFVQHESDIPAALELAFQHDSKVVVEEYIAGREVRCGIWEEADGKYTLLPMTEYFLDNIRTSAHKLATDENGVPFATAEAIVKTDGDRQCPAEIDDTLRAKIEQQAIRAHQATGARDFSLYDVRINEEGTPYFLEACNFCSFSPKSALISMGNAAGRQHPELFHDVLERTVARKSIHQENQMHGSLKR